MAIRSQLLNKQSHLLLQPVLTGCWPQARMCAAYPDRVAVYPPVGQWGGESITATAHGEADWGTVCGTALEVNRDLNTQGLSGTGQAKPPCSVPVFLPSACWHLSSPRAKSSDWTAAERQPSSSEQLGQLRSSWSTDDPAQEANEMRLCACG